MRLIDADRLKRVIEYWRTDLIVSYGENDEYVKCLDSVCEKIEDAPTINAGRIKHGRWIETDSEEPCFYYCSNCGCEWDDETDYCPSCGAQMEVKR